MNDATASSSTAPPPAPQDPLPSSTPLLNAATDTSLTLRPSSALKIRAHYLDDLIRNMDIAVYCELSALYYMEYAPSFLPPYFWKASPPGDCPYL